METGFLTSVGIKTSESVNNDILSKHGLDWEVEKRELFYRGADGSEKLSENIAVVRKDNEMQLGTFKPGYVMAQNHEILSALTDIATTLDIEVEKAGAFKHGKQVYFFLKKPDMLYINNEKIVNYIFALSSHDGSKSLAFGLSNIVMSCQNQFNRFHKEAEVKIRHSSNMGIKLENIKSALNIFTIEEQQMHETFRRWSEKQIQKSLVKELTEYLFETDKLADGSELSTRKANSINSFNVAVNSEMKQKGQNLFGLFNGVTYYTNHVISYKGDAEKKTQSLYTGGSYTMNNKAYDYLQELELAL